MPMILPCNAHQFYKDWMNFHHSSILSNTWWALFTKLSNWILFTSNPCQNQWALQTLLGILIESSWECISTNKNENFKEKFEMGKLTSCLEWRKERWFFGSKSNFPWETSYVGALYLLFESRNGYFEVGSSFGSMVDELACFEQKWV